MRELGLCVLPRRKWLFVIPFSRKQVRTRAILESRQPWTPFPIGYLREDSAVAQNVDKTQRIPTTFTLQDENSRIVEQNRAPAKVNSPLRRLVEGTSAKFL